MAETYEQYEKNRAKGLVTNRSLEERVEAALDQTELFQGVRARVERFLAAYEGFMEFEREHAQAIRNDPVASERALMIAMNMERSIQELASVPDEPKSSLLLDDLRILLDQFPQKS